MKQNQKMQANNGFTIIELMISLFIIALISTILFSSFFILKENLNFTNNRTEKLSAENKLLSFLNQTFKYIYLDDRTNYKILFRKNSDSLGNRKDNIKFASTFPYKRIIGFNIFFDEDNLFINNDTDSNIELSIGNVRELGLDFYKNDNVVEEINEIELNGNDFDYLMINLKLNEQDYNFKVRPYILYK